MMYLYGFFCLNPVTKILRDVLDISYYDAGSDGPRYAWTETGDAQLVE